MFIVLKFLFFNNEIKLYNFGITRLHNTNYKEYKRDKRFVTTYMDDIS